MFIDRLYEYVKDNYKDGQELVKYLGVFAVHPGVVNTSFLMSEPKMSTPFLYAQWCLFALLTPEQAAINILHAIHSDIDDDKYLVNGKYHTNLMYVPFSEKTKELMNKYGDKLWNKSLEIWPISKEITTRNFKL